MMNDASERNDKGPSGTSPKKRVKSAPTQSEPTRRKRKVRRRKPSGVAVTIKYVALFLLVAQMVGLVLLMRYSRTTRTDPDAPLYLASTAVFFMEAMKLALCCIVILFQYRGGFISVIKKEVFDSSMEVAKLCVPSLLYTAQNNLLYLALTNLDAATYQVCYQLKILTTALFSAVMLQRRFSPTKWLSLVILTVGVAIVQLSGSGDQHNHSDNNEHIHHETVAETGVSNRVLGLSAV